jgi:drug/metabolite transporter (DMT)-like permease
MNKDNFKAYLAWVSICIIWGTTYLAIRVGVKDMPPLLFAGLRWLLAGPIILLFLKLRGYKLPEKKDLKHIAVVGLLLLGLGNGLVAFAEQWLPSGLTALLLTTTPFWVVGIESALPTGPKLNLMIVSGLILGILGVCFILGVDFQTLLDSSYILGIIGLTIGELGWSSGTVYSKYVKVSVHPLMNAAIQMCIAGLSLTIVSGLIGEYPKFHFTQNSLLAFLYLLVFGAFIAYGAYIYAISHLPISFISTYAYINPVIALFLGWLILDEKLNSAIIVGALIILLAVYIVKKGSNKQIKIRGV